MNVSLFGLCLGVVFVLTQSVFADTALYPQLRSFDDKREAQIESEMEAQLYPWFRAHESLFFEGTPRIDGAKVNLRSKAFVRPDGKANVVVLHGYDEEMEKYIELVYDLFRSGYNVFLMDLRGFGFSTRIAPDSKLIDIDQFDAYSKDLELFITQTIEKKAPEKPLLVFGHSTGAAVAVRFSQLYPKRAAGFVLSSPLFDMPTLIFSNEFAHRIFGFFTAMGFGSWPVPGQKKDSSYWDFHKSDNSSYPRWKAFYQLMEKPEMNFEELQGPSIHFVTEVTRALVDLKQLDVRKTLQAPYLVFQGGKDVWVRLPEQEKFCREVASCEFVRIDAAKHAIYYEADSIRVPYLKKILSYFEQVLAR